MNFLSHFYFDLNSDPYQILGGVLPDLIKNAMKTANLNPQKSPSLFTQSSGQSLILRGWERHLLIDKHFHSSDFFNEETTELKRRIMHITESTEIRPSFLAHISLELLLDHLLLKKNLVQTDAFYQALSAVDQTTVEAFLINAGLNNPQPVLTFIDQFIGSKYLLSYQKLENISYALNRICMRLWPVCLNNDAIEALNIALSQYLHHAEDRLITVFDAIDKKLEEF